MVAIKRKDNDTWAIPGGMVDADEKISCALKREFIEETMNNNQGNYKLTYFFSQKPTTNF